MYSTSKAALNILTRHMASEFERFGIRVNGVAPDTFPHKVETRRVVEAIAQFDSGSATGEICSLL